MEVEEIAIKEFIGKGATVVEFPTKTLKGYYTDVKLKGKVAVVNSVSQYGEGYVKFVNSDGDTVVISSKIAVRPVLDEEIKKKEMSVYISKAANQLTSHCRYFGLHGADPEIFVTTAKGNLIPAFNFLGSKENPTLAPPAAANSGAKGRNKVYWDGFQAEFDTYPTDCLGWFLDSVQRGLKGVYEQAIKHDKDAKLTITNLVEVSEKQIKQATDEQVAFGCEPSLNAYGHTPLIELDGRRTRLRSAGGHLHFGMSVSPESAAEIVKAIDAVCGVACVSLFQGIDDPRRRHMYGLAGEYRLPKHGLEYRTLSNAWLCHPMITNLVFELARAAYMLGQQGLRECWETTEHDTVKIINTCDVKAAQKQIEKNRKVMVRLLATKLYEENAPKCVDYFLNGVHSIIQDPDDIIGNWNLNGHWISHANGVGKNVASGVQLISAGKKLS